MLRKHPREVLLTALIFVGNSAAGYLLVGFFISYGSRALKMPAQQVLMAARWPPPSGWPRRCSAAGWATASAGCAPSRSAAGAVGRADVGFIDAADIGQFTAALVIPLPLGLTYGPQAALYAEMFPAGVRYSGISVGYALGSILGGASRP